MPQKKQVRKCSISRKTSETNIEIELNLDGSGKHEISTGVGFLDHMLTAVSINGRSAQQLKLDLEQEGILVRYFNKPGLDNCIRISAGRPEDTDRLLKALSNL